ncbi:MAG TPA: AarF/ABC1/UbiB kinase family protein, partial [Stenomitos sp.]
MPQRYDPAEADAALRRYPLRVLRRLWLLVKLVLVFFLASWWGRRGFLSKDPEAVAAREKRAALRFRDAIVELGPTFIKIGQMLATRPDILPLSYTHQLATLQDRVPPFDSGLALAIIRQELGHDVTQLFAEFDVRPLSAASIGQVHLARLMTGERVVVKVQRPNLPEVIALDLAIMRRLAAWAMGKDLARYGVPVAKDMPYVAIVDRLAESLYEQIDFLQEAENIETFRRNFRDFPGVTAPKPYWDYTTTRVLTEEYIEGFKFDDYAGIEAAGLDYVTIANLGVRAFIKQVLEDGFFHADTHPGNVLIRPDGEVVYIDFGMVDTIPADLQGILVDLFIHLVHLNFDAFITDLIRLNFLPEQVDRARVLPIVEDIYTTQMGLTGRTYSTREIIDRVSHVMYDYPFYLPERFAFLMRSVASMEGTVLAHVPDYKFLNVGLPFAGKLMLNPEQRAIREKLIGELMAGGELQLDRLLELFEYA